MVASPLIAVAIITNGQSSNLMNVMKRWTSEGFVPGITLFFCGPSRTLTKLAVSAEAIIHYVDPPYYPNNFHINHKKHAACNAIAAEYIYLVHDRFIPATGVFNALEKALESREFDFGALDVDNLDGTPALREIRLFQHAVSEKINVALEVPGRLVCSARHPDASDHVAINGGQFFLHKSLIGHLARPLRWVEMEDDVLSHDLSDTRGLWINEATLITLAQRNAPRSDPTYNDKTKYLLYRLICNFIAFLLGSISCGCRVDDKKLKHLLSRDFLLVDPLHKATSSQFLPSSLEKLSARARIASNGQAWTNVRKNRLGWKVSGYKGEI